MCFPISRQNSMKLNLSIQLRLFKTKQSLLVLLVARKIFFNCFFNDITFSFIVSESNKTLSLDFPEGSHIPVAPPINAIGLYPYFLKCIKIINCTKLPM